MFSKPAEQYEALLRLSRGVRGHIPSSSEQSCACSHGLLDLVEVVKKLLQRFLEAFGSHTQIVSLDVVIHQS